MKENRSRKKLVLSTEVLRTLVVGGAGGAQQGEVFTDHRRTSQYDSCGIVCGITRKPNTDGNTEAPAACMKTWGMTCPDVIR